MGRVAVIGAGWAGLSAAVRLTQAGHACTVFEASRMLGGRARRVAWSGTNGEVMPIDNGQHILLGAYRETLELMQAVGLEPGTLLHRLPLSLESVNGFRLRAPAWPAPFHLVGAILLARGLAWSDRLAMLRFMSAMRRAHWRLPSDRTLKNLLESHGQSERLCRLVWDPLCIAALNTPAEYASAQVFLNVLRDSLGGTRAASDLLLPCVDLGRLLPDAVEQFLDDDVIRRGQRVVRMTLATPDSAAPIIIEHGGKGLQSVFDGAVLAVSAHHAAALLQSLPECAALAQTCEDFQYQSITTIYLRYPADVTLPAAMLALDEKPTRNWHGQWAFDRSRLTGQPGLIAVVISADGAHRQLSAAALAVATQQQLEVQAGIAEAPIETRVLVEKRATFSCRPDLARPTEETPHAHLMLAGDYTASDYPATLESAVASGRRAARSISGHLCKA